MQTSIDLTRVQLEDYISSLVVNLTGITSDLVRPAFQRRPAPMPEQGVNWCSFYLAESNTEGMWRGPALVRKGKDFKIPDRQIVTFQFFFYGDDCFELCSKFYSGLQIRENWDYLTLKNISILKWDDMLIVPRKYNEVYVYRADIKVYLSVAYNRTVIMPYFNVAPDVDFLFIK